MIPLASDLLPFPGADRWEGLLEFASRQTSFSSSGRIVIVGPIHRKCRGVVVVSVDKIAERCKQATESLSSDRSRENPEEKRRTGIIQVLPTVRALLLPTVRASLQIDPPCHAIAWQGRGTVAEIRLTTIAHGAIARTLVNQHTL